MATTEPQTSTTASWVADWLPFIIVGSSFGLLLVGFVFFDDLIVVFKGRKMMI
jgi:hypothetical protein